MEDDQLQKGFPPVAVRIVGMGDLTAYVVYEHDLNAIERGSPATTMVTLANTLLSIGVSLLGSLLLTGTPRSIYSFNIFINLYYFDICLHCCRFGFVDTFTTLQERLLGRLQAYPYGKRRAHGAGDYGSVSIG
jgi:hypothetical protein